MSRSVIMPLPEFDALVKEGYERLRATQYGSKEGEAVLRKYFETPLKFDKDEQRLIFCDLIKSDKNIIYKCSKYTKHPNPQQRVLDFFYGIESDGGVVSMGDRLMIDAKGQKCKVKENYLMQKDKAKREIICKRI